jgi:DNA-binding NtrC family response regulator
MLPAIEKKNQSGVLVVDDNPNEMRSLVIGLRLEGFDAVGASSGSEAIKKLQLGSYSTVLIDLMMPEMHGLQLARAIKKSFPATRTILMSAYHLSPPQLAKADTGVVGFIPKPFCFDNLVAFIRSKVDPSAPMKFTHPSSSVAGLNLPVDVHEPQAHLTD